jgi:hypothetical protein
MSAIPVVSALLENNAARSVTPSCDESGSVGIAPRVRNQSPSSIYLEGSSHTRERDPGLLESLATPNEWIATGI